MRSYGANTNGIVSQPAQGTLGTCLSAEKGWLPIALQYQSEEMLGAATSHSCCRPDDGQRSLWKLAYSCHFFLCLVYARQVFSRWAFLCPYCYLCTLPLASAEDVPMNINWKRGGVSGPGEDWARFDHWPKLPEGRGER